MKFWNLFPFILPLFYYIPFTIFMISTILNNTWNALVCHLEAFITKSWLWHPLDLQFIHQSHLYSQIHTKVTCCFLNTNTHIWYPWKFIFIYNNIFHWNVIKHIISGSDQMEWTFYLAPLCSVEISRGRKPSIAKLYLLEQKQFPKPNPANVEKR